MTESSLMTAHVYLRRCFIQCSVPPPLPLFHLFCGMLTCTMYTSILCHIYVSCMQVGCTCDNTLIIFQKETSSCFHWRSLIHATRAILSSFSIFVFPNLLTQLVASLVCTRKPCQPHRLLWWRRRIALSLLLLPFLDCCVSNLHKHAQVINTS